jgi:hypothetical protein
MITEEHLKHWIGEIRYQLQGILNEVAVEKVGKGGIVVDGKFVSFDYILEKANKIEGNVKMIEEDVRLD